MWRRLSLWLLALGSSFAAVRSNDDLSPATTYPNLPKKCRGVPPNMLGEFRFFGFRLEGVPAEDMTDLADWEEGMDKREIGGIEWVPWQDGPYYLLAINSPAGLVRRVCTFDPWDNRTSTCTGMDYRDEAVTELLYVTEVDDDCNAMSFGIVTTKSFVPGEVCDGDSPPGCTAISNMFVDKVQGVRLSFDYPETPEDIVDFTRRRELGKLSPATTYPNVPDKCRGVVPNMLGEFRFFGFRFEGVPAEDMQNLESWTEGTDKREIGGIEWVPWQDSPYYLLAINSPAGLVRRFCTFDPWDNRTSTCTGMDYRDEAVTELLYVTEVDDDCNAMSFGIVTTKSFVPGEVCDGESPPGCTAVSNMFVDKVQGERTSFEYPETPDDMDDFTRRRLSILANTQRFLPRESKSMDEIPESRNLGANRFSPATTYRNLPRKCRGIPPNMLGEFRFFGFRLEGVPAQDMQNLDGWTEGMDKREIGGIEWVPWQDGPYYLLAINSPAGLVRRFCTFDPWDNRTSTCTGIDYRDEAVTELLYVTEVDDDCNAMSFGIVTTKTFVPEEVCDGDSPPGCTAISNMFVDKVQGERTSYGYPETPDDVGGEFPPIGEESESSSDESSSDESELTEKPMRQQMGGVCDPVGAYDAMFACENDGEPTQTFINVHEITDRGGGFINLYATRANPLPLLQFNITLQLMPGEKNVYIGAASFLNYHPGPPTESNFPPPHLPALIPIRVEFDKDCNYWMYWLTQKPACVLGTVCYTPPGHPCRVTGTRQEGGRRLAIDDASAVDEGEQGDTNTAVVIKKENDRELMKNRKFLGDYVAEFKCFSGETEHDVFEEKHTIYEMPASINGFYGLERTREDGYTALEKLSINELHKTLFHSFTQNNTDYNLNENDPAWMSDQLMPLVTMDIQFEDREYERYSAVMVGQRPGIGRDDEDLGAHVCKVRAAKEGTSLPDWVGEEDMGCNPAGRYDVTVDCRRYLAPVGVFPEDHRIVDLGYGFYKISFLHFTQDLPQGGAEGPNNQFIMDTLLVEDPTKPGFLTGTTYARNDYYTRAWSTVDFPLYITVQMQTVDDDGDGKCDTWSATLQGYRPGPIPFDGDVMHYCGFEASTIHVGAVVDESCMDGASDCQGGCYEGQYDYVGLCVAGEGLENTPNFVREVLMPNPVVMDSTCEELGFTVQLEGGSCPDAFYGMNDVCIFTNDESGEWIQEKVPGFFDNTINPYVDYFEFPWGQYWQNDNPQCLYTENSPGAPSIPTNCAIAGRYDCPIERCVNGTEILIEGGDYTQTMLIHETGLGYFDMEVIDNPFGVSWSAIMYQKPWDKLTLTGAMYRTSNHESTYENPDHQLLEARFDPVMSGCTTFQMILRGYTSVPRDWESPYHMCDFVCNRVRNFGSVLGENPNSMTPY